MMPPAEPAVELPALSPGLYIVATPIGNLGDITQRAADTLRRCKVIACEDTRVTAKLLRHLGIAVPMRRYDDHSDAGARAELLAEMTQSPVALVSDAGTPLISDPGYRLVRDARAQGIAVTSLPGASAATVALTLAGLPTDRFLFAGFLPPRDKGRADVLAELATLRATLVFYETGPRLVASLAAIDHSLPGREVAVARELTKTFEECRTGSAAELADHYRAHPPKGEIVLLVGPPPAESLISAPADIDALLGEALKRMKASQAATTLANSHGLDRKMLYGRALELRSRQT